jgi:DNA-binding MurR/RpiR family transcriptional regulator
MPCRVSARLPRLSMAEREVTRFFQQNREEGLIALASSLASKIGTSNGTVVRTALALGYASLAELRRQLADGLRHSSPRCCYVGSTYLWHRAAMVPSFPDQPTLTLAWQSRLHARAGLSASFALLFLDLLMITQAIEGITGG